MATTRKASTIWQGNLLEGKGKTTFNSSGLGTYDVSWPARSAEPNGVTSPEELIAESRGDRSHKSVKKVIYDNGKFVL